MNRVEENIRRFKGIEKQLKTKNPGNKTLLKYQAKSIWERLLKFGKRYSILHITGMMQPLIPREKNQPIWFGIHVTDCTEDEVQSLLPLLMKDHGKVLNYNIEKIRAGEIITVS